jgi:hypothetical protein
MQGKNIYTYLSEIPVAILVTLAEDHTLTTNLIKIQ